MKLSTRPPETPPEHPDATAINAALDAHAETLHASAVSLNHAYETFWGGSIQTVCDRFNAFGLALVIEAGTAHNAQAGRVNDALDAALVAKPELAARLSTRAIAVPRYLIQWSSEPVEGARIRLLNGVFEELPE